MEVDAQGRAVTNSHFKEVAGLVLCGLSLFALVALASFRLPALGESSSNVCGVLGDRLAFTLLLIFGKASFFLMAYLATWGALLVARRGGEAVLARLMGILSFTFVLALLLSLRLDPARPFAQGTNTLPFGPGGTVGAFLGPKVYRILGPLGSYLILLLLGFISLLLATDFFFLDTLRKKLGERGALPEEEGPGLLVRAGAALRAWFTLAARGARAFREWWEAGEAEPAVEGAGAGRGAAAGRAATSVPSLERKALPSKEDEVPGGEESEEEETEEEEVPEEEVEEEESLPPGRSPKGRQGKKKPGKGRARTMRNLSSAPPPPSPSRRKVSLSKGTRRGRYVLPPVSLLRDPPPPAGLDEEHLHQMAQKIVEKLKSFRIGAQVVGYSRGPAVTLFELRLDEGVKVGQITAREDDLALALAATSLRVVAPLPGKGTVGVEVPNEHRDIVVLKELLAYAKTLAGKAELPLFLGRDVMGAPVISDLAKMPHLLIAGATGSGKSVCLNTILLSLLTTRTPDEVGLILVDPKMVELQLYEAIPHLLTPIVTDMTKVPGVLEWAVDEMERRYRHLSLAKVRSLKDYNKLGEKKLRQLLGDWFDSGEKPTPRRFPSVVVVIDEFADLMVSASKDVELLIQRLAQKSRAVGIHVILATQRPSREVVTGIIKSNLPTRISFKVTSSINSRVVLDQVGAERLIGNGDMLFHPPGTSILVRAQGVYVSDGEIHEIVDWWRRQAKPDYVPEILNPAPKQAEQDPSKVDPLYEDAVRIVLGEKRGAATLLQRAFKIGYTRASRLIELMEEDGIVGKYVGSKSREVLLTLEEWEARKKKQGA